MLRLTLFATFLLSTLLTAGCAHMIAPLSDQQVDQLHGHRTLGSRIEDSAIERKTYINIHRNNAIPDDSRVVVTSWNGQVLLAGQVANAPASELAEKTAREIRHVQHVHNELAVRTPISLLVRMNDGWITTRVKARLLFGPDVPGRRIKVVTENGVVYLMGLVNHAEAEQAVNAARAAYGVQKIVKIFEYIDDQPAAG